MLNKKMVIAVRRQRLCIDRHRIVIWANGRIDGFSGSAGRRLFRQKTDFYPSFPGVASSPLHA